MRRMISVFLILFMLFSCVGCAAQADAGTRLMALNVDKADCLLLRFDDQAYLIDSGYDYTYNALAELLRREDVTRLNGVFLTHCDKDHYGGLAALAQSDIAVDAWYAAAIYYDVTEDQHPMIHAAALRGEAVIWLSAGDTLQLGDSATLRVLGPLTRNTANENNNSLVFSVETKDGSLLFTGDMKLEEEYELMEAGLIGPADVLKVPFHGDNTASSEAFVDRVSPQIALISTSTAQEPDTPASSILKRYARYGAEILVTQDYQRGVEISLRNGTASSQPLLWEAPDYSKSIQADITPEDDLLTLRSSSDQPIDLSGWILFSTKGGECVRFPEGSILPANGVFRIGSRATFSPADWKLDEKRMWHKSKWDQARLYDLSGSLAAVTDNGKPE